MMKKENKIILIFEDSEKETPKKMISIIKMRRELFKEYEKKREEFRTLEKEYIIFLNTEYEIIKNIPY